MKPIAELTVAEIIRLTDEQDQIVLTALLGKDLAVPFTIENVAVFSDSVMAFPIEFVGHVIDDGNWLHGVNPGVESEYYPEGDEQKWRFTIWFADMSDEYNGVMMAFDHYDVEGMRQMVAWIRKVIQKEMTGEQFWSATEQYRK